MQHGRRRGGGAEGHVGVDGGHAARLRGGGGVGQGCVQGVWRYRLRLRLRASGVVRPPTLVLAPLRSGRPRSATRNAYVTVRMFSSHLPPPRLLRCACASPPGAAHARSCADFFDLRAHTSLSSLLLSSLLTSTGHVVAYVLLSHASSRAASALAPPARCAVAAPRLHRCARPRADGTFSLTSLSLSLSRFDYTLL